MQDVIEELIRGIGFVAPRIVTFGKYRRSGRLLKEPSDSRWSSLSHM
jgi:hypothetical protein